MTAKQLEKKMEIARKTGEAHIDDCVLIYFSDENRYSLRRFSGYWQTIATGYTLRHFDFLID